jgi:putative phosphoesterase
MKILIISDSHRNKEIIREVIKTDKFDKVIHCGDSGLKLKELKGIYAVRGNCDFDQKIPEEIVTVIDNKKFFISHGHKYNVKYELDRLYQKAEEISADVVCFGHTHYPGYEIINDILFINPGSLTRGRGFMKNTYAVLDTTDLSVKIYKIE